MRETVLKCSCVALVSMAALGLVLHCSGAQPTLADAQSAARFACEALAVQVTTGTPVPVDKVIARACRVERLVREMQAVIEAESGPIVDEWPELAPAPDWHPLTDAGAR